MNEVTKENDENISTRNSESIGFILKNIVNEIAGSVSSFEFEQILSPLKTRPTAAKSLYNMQTNDIINNTHEIIDRMYSETGIDTKYDEITQLINDTKTDKNTKAWRPIPGDCNMQLEAYKKKSMLETKSKLEKLVQDERNTRILLKKSLDHKRTRIESLLKDMKTGKEKLERNSKNDIE